MKSKSKDELKEELIALKEKAQEARNLSIEWSNWDRKGKMLRFFINGFLMIGSIYFLVVIIWYNQMIQNYLWAIPGCIIFVSLFLGEKLAWIWFHHKCYDIQDKADKLDQQVHKIEKELGIYKEKV